MYIDLVLTLIMSSEAIYPVLYVLMLLLVIYEDLFVTVLSNKYALSTTSEVL